MNERNFLKAMNRETEARTPVREKKELAKNPLEIWQSKEVTELLLDFFTANFEKAGLQKELAKEFVLRAWDNKDSMDFESLRNECNSILMQAMEKVEREPDENEPLDMVSMENVDTFLDIGANKLTTINYYAKKHPNIKKFIGVDIIPQRKPFIDEARSSYFQVDPEANSFPVNDQSIDLVNIQFVLHHFPDLDSIKRSLSICKNIIKEKGRLVLWEETFTKDFDDSIASENIRNLGIKTDLELTKKFYNLDEHKRWEFIMANDWLINVNNPHMPWTGQHYTWDEWNSLLTEYDFSLKEEHNLGLRTNGRIKQGAHMMGIFKNS